MKTITRLALVLVALAVALPAAAQPARLYDKEVKSLVEQSKKTFERFWDALDNNLKNTTFKGASGEWVVKRVGEAYKNTIDIADKRIAESYSASDEVSKIFSEAVRIDNFVAQQGAAMKGASEWQAHANVLKQLAAQFGGAFLGNRRRLRVGAQPVGGVGDPADRPGQRAREDPGEGDHHKHAQPEQHQDAFLPRRDPGARRQAGKPSSGGRETVSTGSRNPYARLPALIGSLRVLLRQPAPDDQTNRHRSTEGFLADRQSEKRQPGCVGQKTKIRYAQPGETLFREGDAEKRTVYVLSGAVEIREGGKVAGKVTGGTSDARNPLSPKLPRRHTVVALGNVEYITIDSDLLDVMLTWDQTGSYEVSELRAVLPRLGTASQRLGEERLARGIPL